MSVLRKIKKLLKVVQVHGPSGLGAYFRARSFNISEAGRFEKWLERSGRPREDAKAAISVTVNSWPAKPLISVILPVYNIDERWLRKCIDSVCTQTYQNWDLCIADDASTAAHIRPILETYQGSDERIKVVFREVNGHISAASNSALDIATGEFCVLLDHDDELTSDALYWVAKEIVECPETAMIYSDEDLIDSSDTRSQPKFKPDFSRDLLYSLNLVTHLSAYRTELLRDIGKFRIGLEGSQDYDLALRVIEQINENQIRHIPRMLYHWRAVPGSVALDGGEKPYAHERARQAIREHFERTGVKATVEETHFNLHRVRYALPEKLPTVSIIFWGDERPAVPRSIEPLTSDLGDDNTEIIDANISDDLAAALNAAAMSSSGDVIVFVRSGLAPRADSPLAELVGMALQPKIGAVGGLVIGTDGTVQAGGIVLDEHGLTNVAHAGFPHDVQGNLLRNILIGNFSAVCLDAFAIRKEVFVKAGPFDEELHDKDLIAADMCLRLRNKGYRITLTPYAKFAGPKNKVLRGREISADEHDLFASRWAAELKTDPFSNPNLTSDGRFSIKL